MSDEMFAIGKWQLARKEMHSGNFPLDLETPPNAHAVRLAFQSVLLALLWEMSQPTIIDAKYNLGLM